MTLALAALLPVLTACVTEAPAPVAQAERAPARAPALPLSLVGLSEEALRQVLGRPTLQRREPPGEIWQYVGEQCVLLVVLYRPDAGGRSQVAQVNAVATADAATPAAVSAAFPADRCLAALARTKRSGVES